MRISHKYKFIFISKPRCASTTVRKILDPFSDIISSSEAPYHHHATALELKLHFDEKGWNWNDYFVFTTVRNPWDMMVSYYSRFKPDVNGIYNYEASREGVMYQPDKASSFENWIMNGMSFHRLRVVDKKIQKGGWTEDFSKFNLANTVNDVDGRCLVNRIIKTENLEPELAEIMDLLGLGSHGFPGRLNGSERGEYRSYYNDVTRRKIELEFASDIQFGSYEF